ncbi:MAG: UDP-N-acetylglucosamine 1-carboxyvinyltransferase, partial [Lactobacillus delbrueckii]
PKRTRHVPELQKMGAPITVVNNIILVQPGSRLHGAVVHADEIRAGACLMLTGLMVDGETVINNAGNILRGYDRVEEKLRQLGADVVIRDVED